MNQRLKNIGSVMVLMLTFCLSNALAREIFVSPTGDDAATGSRDTPLRTLAQAQKTARSLKGAPLTIHLLPGTFYIPETLILTSEDSGTREAPIKWEGEEGRVTISGGVKLDLKWEPYKNSIMQAKVPQGTQSDQLFLDGRRQTLARYPNADPKIDIYQGYAADAISPKRAAMWADPSGGIMHAMHGGQWGGFSYRILSKDANNNVKFEGGWQGNRPSGPHNTYRYVENIFEELDAPGEWFLNFKTSTLYFYPPAGIDLTQGTIELPRLKHLIELKGSQQSPIRFIEFHGITFEHTLRTFMETKEPILRSDWTVYRGGSLLFTGSEDCLVADCYFDQVGGNAIFVNNFNRRLTIKGCRIEDAGAGGVTFLGDPAAVRNALSNYDQHNDLKKIDRTPGPQSENYPADCKVSDCLITHIGRWEKQATGVGIDMAERITVSHCSIYDTPRAGLNIGDGCWGGHLIEYCDVFDTVKETGDHGSFNSWGRDRFWGLNGADLNSIMLGKDKDIPLLDCVETNTICNSRWRCDHGWDIDLDDGSSNYHIFNNLCLNGGLKNREGFARVVENNVIVNNSFHPHVWFKDSGDIFRHNIVCTNYRPIGVPQPWGQEVDYNLLHASGAITSSPAKELQADSKRDEHSIKADALFVDPASGNFNVRDTSPALALGFKNFPMDQFGVQKPALKAIARVPAIKFAVREKPKRSDAVHSVDGAKFRNIVGEGEMSVYGTPGETGVLIIEMPGEHPFAKAGLQKSDVILGVSGLSVSDWIEFEKAFKAAKGPTAKLKVLRKQIELNLQVPIVK